MSEQLKDILDEFVKENCTCGGMSAQTDEEETEEDEDSEGGSASEEGDDEPSDESNESGGEEEERTSPEDCPVCGNQDQQTGDSLANDFKDLHPQWNEEDELGEEVRKELTKNFAREMMDKNPGSVPGNIQEELNYLVKGENLLKKYINNFHARIRTTNRKRSLRVINRKVPDIRPIVMPGRMKQKKTHLAVAIDTSRSEEHTSELQSRGHLVCRLLLE